MEHKDIKTEPTHTVCAEEIIVYEPEFIQIEEAKATTVYEKAPGSARAKKICCVCQNSICNLLPFPNKTTDPQRYLKWCAKLKMETPRSDFLCVLHFTPKDVYHQNGKILLKITAVPSKNLPLETIKQDPLNQQNDVSTQQQVKTYNSVGLIKANSPMSTIVLKRITKAEFIQNMQKNRANALETDLSESSNECLRDYHQKPKIKTPESKSVEPPTKVQKLFANQHLKIGGGQRKKKTYDKGNQTDIQGHNLTMDMLRTQKIADLIKTPQQLKSWTGIRSFDILEKLVREFTRNEMRRPPLFAMDRTDRILATLIRMHLNLPLQCLGTLFNADAEYLKKIMIPNFLNLIETIDEHNIDIEGRPTVREFKETFEEEILLEEADGDDS